MKSWMWVLALVAVLGFTGLADAQGKGGRGKNGKGGIQGKVETVAAGSFTMTIGGGGRGKKNANANANANANVQTKTVKFNGNTIITVNGAAGGKLDASAVGQRASVVGSSNADGSINATHITLSSGHGKGKGKNKKNT